MDVATVLCLALWVQGTSVFCLMTIIMNKIPGFDNHRSFLGFFFKSFTTSFEVTNENKRVPSSSASSLLAIATRLNGIQETQTAVRGERPPAVSAGYCSRRGGAEKEGNGGGRKGSW